MKERIWTGPFVVAWCCSFGAALAIHAFVHLPGLLKSWGAKETVIGAVIATTSLTAIVVRPAIGKWMDTRGRRTIAIAGALIHVVACAAYLTVDKVGPWLLCVRALHGVAGAMLFSVYFTMAADMVPMRRRTEGIAWFGVSGMLPVALGPLLGDLILRHADYPTLFLVLTGIAVIGFAMTFALKETRRAGQARAGLWAALKLPALLPLWMLGTVLAIGITSFFVFLKTYAQEESLGSISTFFTPFALTAVLLRVFAGWVPDRVGPRRALLPAMSVLLVGIVVLGAATAGWHVAMAGVLCGLGHGYVFPILSALIIDRAPEGDRGAAVTLFTALFDVGLLLGGPSLGWVIETWGYRAMFGASALVLVLGSLVFARWDRTEAGAAT